MIINTSQPHSSSAIPPRALNVQKFAESRAAELRTLQSVVANRLNNDFRSRRSKRRRTTGYDNRGVKNSFKKRKRTGVSNASNCDSLVNNGKPDETPRHIRRRIELRENPRLGFCASGDGTKRLRTHVWHAKRFTMTKLWGFHLPLHQQGRGRGSRALLKKLKHGVLVHDASYFGVVQLEGPEDLLMTIVDNLLVPSPSSYCESTLNKILSGAIYGSAMLQRGRSAFSHSIAPVTFMMRPRHQGKDDTGDQKTNGCSDQNTIDTSTSSRQLWVWIHPAGFREGYYALKHACEAQTDLTSRLVNCISLEDHLGKIELMGSKAFELLQKILRPLTNFSENSSQLNRCSDIGTHGETKCKMASIIRNEDDFSSSAVICLAVKDPRTSTKEELDALFESKPSISLCPKQDEITRTLQMLNPIADAGSVTLPWANSVESSDILENANLWDACKVISPPLEESLLCHEKHHQRMKLFRMINKNSLKADALVKDQVSKLCPIMLYKGYAKRGSIEKWSLILPLSWARAFWIPLVTNGGHAIGLREKHWIASDVSLPYFPSDFPDSNAYSCFMAKEVATTTPKEDLCSSMSSFKAPFLPPWHSIQLAFRYIKSGDAQSRSELSVPRVNDSSMRQFESGEWDMTVAGGHGDALRGFVARTSSVLSLFLNQIDGRSFLLFPRMPDENKCISKCMRDENILGQCTDGSSSQISFCQRLCFLRVLLHAYKEGTFEEGAVVCAPKTSDILSWTVRSAEENKVQIPHSSLESYFIQQPSGEWELQVPEDPLVRESFRWPIGFVTTGFVRGSKKPAAGALCEAVLLARLREEQWKVVPTKQRRKEVYVLVRNLRSTAYRLALATIILEEQEEDTEYI